MCARSSDSDCRHRNKRFPGREGSNTLAGCPTFQKIAQVQTLPSAAVKEGEGGAEPLPQPETVGLEMQADNKARRSEKWTTTASPFVAQERDENRFSSQEDLDGPVSGKRSATLRGLQSRLLVRNSISRSTPSTSTSARPRACARGICLEGPLGREHDFLVVGEDLRSAGLAAFDYLER